MRTCNMISQNIFHLKKNRNMLSSNAKSSVIIWTGKIKFWEKIIVDSFVSHVMVRLSLFHRHSPVLFLITCAFRHVHNVHES